MELKVASEFIPCGEGAGAVLGTSAALPARLGAGPTRNNRAAPPSPCPSASPPPQPHPNPPLPPGGDHEVVICDVAAWQDAPGTAAPLYTGYLRQTGLL
jgi:hypothetical protein